MIKTLSIALILIFNSFVVNAQTIGSYKSGYKKQGNTLSFLTSNGAVKFEFCTPDIFRIRASWNGKFEAQENLIVNNYNWPLVNAKVAEMKDHFLLTTAKLMVKLYKNSFKIDVFDINGNLLSSEVDKGTLKEGNAVGVTKKLAADEHFFGFGERMDFMDRRSKKVSLNVGRGKGLPHAIGAYNILEANYCPVPFFMSTKGYGIFMHNSFATNWGYGG